MAAIGTLQAVSGGGIARALLAVARDDDLGAAVSEALASARDAVRLPLTVLVLGALAILLVRGVARLSRRRVRLWLIPHRSSEALPEEVLRLLESWHQQLQRRWWWRLLFGQPGLALELVVARNRAGDHEARLGLVCPARLVDSIANTLVGCYADVRWVRARGGLPRIRSVIRLRKRRHFVQALQTPESDEQRHLIDAVLRHVAHQRTTAVLQYVITPVPLLFDVYSRWRYGARERSLASAQARSSRHPGLRSELIGQELKAGLRVQHHGLFFTDIRVGASTYREARSIAGIVRGESAAENRLIERHMLPGGRRGLYLKRIRDGVNNPMPSSRLDVLSSAELVALWRLPSPEVTAVPLVRSAVPRLPATPEISRRPEDVLARDEHGPVGIRPQDKTDGLGLIGGQKTGKTSLLCRTVQADANDERCALIVLMPKPGDALKALSMVPAGRTVHYLDLEHPEFGINPLLAVGDPAMVADKIVEAFRDIHAEGDIRGSSDRYLRQAAQASIGATRLGVIEGAPTLWHMYRILMPAEKAFRERIADALYLDSRYTDTATFFGVELPSDLENAPGQTVAKLDAPRNKILRLLVESLDKVLRHPLQLPIDDVLRNREVLIVDGKMGTFGADNCRVMMQFLLNALYGALQRQQQLPEHERARVALKVDEAHLILNESFADALATLRSAGLEVVAAWQYGAQIQDPKIRSGMMSLLRQRCMFSMGETEDAREMSSIGMTMYSDMLRSDRDSRGRAGLTPDVIFNLPNHHAVCSWISSGARAPAFIAQTLPLETRDEVVEHHLAAQRERGCHVPERMPDPLPDLDWKGLREFPSAPVEVQSNGGAAAPQGEEEPEPVVSAGVALDFDPAASSIDRSLERPARPASEAPPETFAELDLDDVSGMIWEQVERVASEREREPSHRELEILAALSSYRVLFASQIHRRWWRGSSLRAARQTLNRMARAGWVRRFKFRRAVGGTQQRVYCLTRQGFELAQQRTGRYGPYIDPDTSWRDLQLTDPRRILRDLHVNGWALAFEERSGKMVQRWRGPREGRLEPPRQRVRGEWRDITPTHVIVGSNHKLRDYEPHRFEPVSPDATLELRLPIGDGGVRFDLLLELDRARSAAASEDRLRRYDGLISGWAGMLDRYKSLGTPPVVVFVCEDERAAMNLIRIADRALTGRLAKPGTEETEWPFPARRGTFFVVERDIHEGSLEALQVPEHPAELRARLHGPKARVCRPRRVHLVEPHLLDGR